MAGSELQTNLNVAPYFDDYDEDKQFYRILFRPSVAVQARELTQLQTILQKQISRFGNKIFKDGSLIEAGNFTSYPAIPQMKFRDSNTSTFDFSFLTDNNGGSVANSYLLVSNTTGVRAVVFAAYQGAESVVRIGSADTNRVYLQYISGGSLGTTSVNVFRDNSEQIDVYHPSNQSKNGPLNYSNFVGKMFTLTSNTFVNAYGVGYGMTIGSSLIFQKGHFLKTLNQSFMVAEHTANAAGYRVGWNTNEYIVTELTDESLNDNAIGSYNYTAPGAHRLKLVPVPVSYDASNTQVTIPTSFLPVLEFDGGDGRIVINRTDTQLSGLGDVIAKRTFEESGDYIVKPFSIDVTAHESNTQSFYYNVGAGIAYVDGYRVELNSPRKVEVSRAIDTEVELDKIVTFNLGSYVKVDNFAGNISVENLPEVVLYTGNQELLSNNISITNPMGTKAGNANIKAILYDTGSAGTGKKGTYLAKYLFYITNIRMDSGKNFVSDADSFYYDDPLYGKCYGDFVKDTNGNIIVYDKQLHNYIFPIGYPGVKRLTDSAGTNNSKLVFRRTTPTNGGVSQPVPGEIQATFTTTGSEIFDYGSGYLSDVNSEDVNIAFKYDTTSKVIKSDIIKAGYNSVGANITSSTTFAGDNWYPGMMLKLEASGSSYYVTVRAINSGNSVYVTPASAVPAGPSTMRQFWRQGSHVDFTGSGNTIYIDSPTSMTINLAIDPSDLTLDFVGQIPTTRTTSVPIEKVVNKSSCVKINCNSHWNGRRGPWNLGLTDVYKLANVHIGSLQGTSYDEINVDHSDWFYIDSGQTEDSYRHAKLYVKPEFAEGLVSNTTLLVKVNHFTANVTASKTGYFSIDSYSLDDANPDSPNVIATAEIPVYTDVHSLPFDLRNSIDLRHVYQNTANVTTNKATATVNPANNSSLFVSGVNAGVAVEPNSNFNCNVEYYLARNDILVLNKDGSLSAKNGQPAVKPRFPALNKSGIQLAEVYVPPYPSLTFTESE